MRHTQFDLPDAPQPAGDRDEMIGPSPCEPLESRFLPALVMPSITPLPTPSVSQLSVPQVTFNNGFAAVPTLATPATPAFFTFPSGNARVAPSAGFDAANGGGIGTGLIITGNTAAVGPGFDLTSGGGIGSGIDLATGALNNQVATPTSSGFLSTSPAPSTSAPVGLTSFFRLGDFLFSARQPTEPAVFLGNSDTVPIVI
jgi:hypothetical protein